MASILTLRFFHSYPEEVTRTVRLSCNTTDQLLRHAREEARLFFAGTKPKTAAGGVARA